MVGHIDSLRTVRFAVSYLATSMVLGCLWPQAMAAPGAPTDRPAMISPVWKPAEPVPSQAARSRPNGLQPTSYPPAVTTYHYDVLRTGWDSQERNLTAANAGGLRLQHVAFFNGQVDAEPLYVSGVTLGGGDVHDLVYVVTENNWVYAIDAESGAIALRRSLGTPVPESALPGQCVNNSNAVGITSTPVIDTATGKMYLIAYTYSGGKTTYTLHALSLSSLGDTITPRVVAASGRLANGQAYNFNPAITRQRAALLLSKSMIYAGFGSFCDAPSRGWVLGWHESNLAPLGVADLANSNATAMDNGFLTSVWMAGFGISADANGSIYFATSNSDASGTSWSATTNLEESVVKMPSTLGSVQGYYTPDDPVWGQKPSDPIDGDLGSGGVMLMPDQPGATPHLATAGGKNSGVLLLNRDNLGGYGHAQLDQHYLGGCWCSTSYFRDANDTGHVVVSAGTRVTIYTVQTSPTPKLINPIAGPAIQTGQDPGFFTTVSSNGTAPGSAVVWALSRPVDQTGYINLYGFNAATGAELLAIRAGIWPSPEADADLVPTVANGRVFVPSYNQLAIFGLGTPGAPIEITAQAAPAETPLPVETPHQLSGLYVGNRPNGFTLQTRIGATVVVDSSAAMHFGAAEQPAGTPMLVRGDFTADGGFKALTVLHLKPQPALWPRDR
jgi:hypothetical protein